ncbi:hypothetical protein [Candidatus Sororendozoicomonas aggregata]|uniref:hypothetical protein n=1 Tax=Candidatus Sororendozoicomonas aggregata TaxID=3073239 RepID=UPI002ED53FE3
MKKIIFWGLLFISLDSNAFLFGAVKECNHEESMDFNVYDGSIIETKDIKSMWGTQKHIIKFQIKYCKETIQYEIYEYEKSSAILVLGTVKNTMPYFDIDVTSDLSGKIFHHYHSGVESALLGSSTGLTYSKWQLIANILPLGKIKKIHVKKKVFKQLNILSQIGVDLSGESIDFIDNQELWVDTTLTFSESMNLYTAYSSNGHILFQILLNHSNYIVAFTLNIYSELHSYWRRGM